MRALSVALLLLVALAATLGAQTSPRPSATPRPAAAPAQRAATAEPVDATTFEGIQEQRGDFGVVGPATGGGVRITRPPADDTVWAGTMVAPVPVTARVTAELEVHQVGPGGLGIAIGDAQDENVTPLLITLLPGGSLAVRDRAGSVVVPARLVPQFTVPGSLSLSVELRGSAVTVAANGRPVGAGTAGLLVEGPVSVVVAGGGDVTVRRVRLERLTGVPASQVALRTTKRIPLPVARAARFFDHESSGGGSLVVDTLANTVTFNGPPDTDRATFATRLGILPAAVRIEADLSMPRTCESRIAGLLFGRRSVNEWLAFMTLPEGQGLYSLRLYRIGGSAEGGLGGATIVSSPFATPAERQHFVVEIRGGVVSWTFGDRTERVSVGSDASGQFGIIAGPGCSVRYENLRITPAL